MDMDHADAVELIELAAAEPDGLERLMAGDTPESAAVAGHLAGCPSCVAELARIRRAASVIRQVIAEAPDPALRERTLAFVREVGRDRSGGAAFGPGIGVPAGLVAPPDAASPEVAAAMPIVPRASRPRWIVAAGLAAALLLAVGLGFGAARLTTPPDVEAGYEIEVLQVTAETTLRLDAQPDTRRVALLATAGGAGAQGTLLFSPSTGELVMVATGLAQLEPGQEYGCWVEANGERRRIGKMYPGGDLQSWAGMVDGLGELPDDAVFGVSLVPAGGGKGEPRLTGGL
jgi:anti-sigma factor RsiW